MHIYCDVEAYVQKMLDRNCDREALIARALQADYPDLKMHIDAIGRSRFCSKQVNTYGDKLETRYGPDNRLEVWICLEDKSTKVYADPPMYVIGHRMKGWMGVVPLASWEEVLIFDGYDKAMIKEFKSILDNQKPVQYG